MAEPIATFKVSEEGRNGELLVYSDRIERRSHTAFRKNRGLEVTPFSRISSVELKKGLARQAVKSTPRATRSM